MSKGTIQNQRRYVVTSYDPAVLRTEARRIEQGYMKVDTTSLMRVRIMQGSENAVLTTKSGHAAARRINEHVTDIKTGLFLYKNAPYRTVKRRHYDGIWTLDMFLGELKGLVVAEVTTADPDLVPGFPEWLHAAHDVTESMTDLHFAMLARDMRTADDVPIRNRLPWHVPSILLTGPPASGKSTAMRNLNEEFGGYVMCVPEVASIVIGQLGLQPPAHDEHAYLAFQRLVYQTQTSFQEASALHARLEGKDALLLDRGTVDGAAYLKGELNAFEWLLGTTRHYEYGNYDLVLILDLPPESVYESVQGNNVARSESYEQAEALRDGIVRVWREHPRYVIISSHGTWEEKYAEIRAHVQAFLKASTASKE